MIKGSVVSTESKSAISSAVAVFLIDDAYR